MSEEKTAIQKLYEDPKSKNFVNHLIRAYLPISKPTKVWVFEDKKPQHKCNVCNHDLIDLGTVIGRMQNSEEYAKDFVDNLRKQIHGEEVKREDNPIIKHLTHGAIMAWQGEKTTTYLCADCIKNLLDMVTFGLLAGDKNIIWLTNQMRRDQVFTHFKESPKLDDTEKEEVKEIQKKADKKKMTFADLGVLQGLKEKLEAEEKATQEKETENLTKN
jgi:hypothetical protein